jgi:asparagine synthase (glutamine-hydrolysing)
MCAAMEHRGPDSRGVHLDDGVGLGIQRLRIIDLETGDQPIFNEDGSVVVVLNGEIYNYRELRADLESRGHRFATRTDTEVIVHAYEEHGLDFVHALHGMFGLAVWDARRRRLVLARDRAGKKPLFYCLRNGMLRFASELGALMSNGSVPRDVDPHALDAYLAFRYIPSPLSVFREVRKLPPACRAVFDAEGLRIDRYWRLDFSCKRRESDAELLDETRERLRIAVRRRMIADVPLGAFLSGGVDSAAVVAAMAEASPEPVKTFSIGFHDPTLDERELARVTASHFETEHHEIVVEPNAIEIIPDIIRHYGEPFADATAIPTFYLAQMARRHVTVALNGDGGDETFAGYRRYVAALTAGRLDRAPRPVRRALAGLARRLPADGRIDSPLNRVRRLGTTLAMDPHDRYLAYMTELQGLHRGEIYTGAFQEALGESRVAGFTREPWMRSSASDPLDFILDVDSATYLPDDLLVKVDIATMAHSLEGRSPLLDHEFMQFAATLPRHLKIDGRETKAGLRRALRGWVPDEVLDAPKRGFQPPLARWFRGDLKQFAREVLLDPLTERRGIIDPGASRRLLDRHESQQADNSQGIWTLLILELWHREHVDSVASVAAPLRPDRV